jgi:hypothetical protein
MVVLACFFYWHTTKASRLVCYPIHECIMYMGMYIGAMHCLCLLPNSGFTDSEASSQEHRAKDTEEKAARATEAGTALVCTYGRGHIQKIDNFKKILILARTTINAYRPLFKAVKHTPLLAANLEPDIYYLVDDRKGIRQQKPAKSMQCSE